MKPDAWRLMPIATRRTILVAFEYHDEMISGGKRTAEAAPRVAVAVSL
jgi:hypothetical protein